MLLAEIRSRSLVERVSTLINHDPDISKTKLVAQIQAVDSTVGTKEIPVEQPRSRLRIQR